MALVHVTSEIGPLRAVLVHTPGRELVAVTPGNREDYLYDDIIDLELAQREHRRVLAGLGRGAPASRGGRPPAQRGGGPAPGARPPAPPPPRGAAGAPRQR